jgi:signal transduction histidine kinase
LYISDKIFDPFFTTKEEGTGLGLSVCQKIIHDLGGQIRVSSKGYGTTFHILIPYL